MENPFGQLGMIPLINAAGSLTTLGGELMHPEVVDAIAAASRYFVDIHELHQVAGRRIAELTGVEAAHVCSCGSAGVTLIAAACMAGSDSEKIARLPITSGMKNKFIVQRVHRNAFDHAIHIAGGEFVEINADIESLNKALCRNDIAAVFYTFAWFCAGESLPLQIVASVAGEHGIPLLVDAAQVPPVEGFSQFIEQGVDLIVFSGGKALHGPQTSGVILGRENLVEACALNDSPNIKCIGRGMKVSKENIIALVKAIELYLKKDHAAEMGLWLRRVAFLLEKFSDIKGIEAQKELPVGTGYAIPYVTLRWPENGKGLSYQNLTQRLREGTPAIAVRFVAENIPSVKSPHIRIYVHTLLEGEEVVVANKIISLLT